MKYFRALIVIGVFVSVAGLVFTPQGEAQMGYGMHGGMWGPGQGDGQGGGWSYCPYCGRNLRGQGGYPMGPGRMGSGYGGYGMMGRGQYGHQGMGPGMMGPGYGDDRGYGNPQGRNYRQQEPLKKDEAKKEVNQMLVQSRNPNLKVGGVEEKGNTYEIEIQTKGGELVDKIQVDKDTGLMRSVY